MTEHNQYDRLKQLLLPILAEATIGNFKAKVAYDKDQTPEFNELLSGVESLLNTAQQQRDRIAELELQLHNVQSGTTEILARVLDRNQSGAAQETSR